MASPGLEASTQPGGATLPDRFGRRLTIGFSLVALVLAAFEAWTSRFAMNPEGIQYLDNAALYRAGDFHNALSTMWSPLYPWVIAAAEAIVRPSREEEFALAHALNFAVFAASIACFLFFLTSLPKPLAPSLLLLSYASFLYCSLDFTHLGYVTPDLLVNCFAFLVAGLLARVTSGDSGLIGQVALGASLGFGYLAKAPFLPIAVVCFVLAFIAARKRALVSAAVFLAITAPYIAVLSLIKHRFTFGDSAKLNLAWHVNGLRNTNWQGGPPEDGYPFHSTRQLASLPEIFEFAEPVAGTYPPWYDPSYWNEGVRVTYRVGPIARSAWQQVRLYTYLLHRGQVPLILGLLALFAIVRDRKRVAEPLRAVWPILVLGLFPFAMYAPVHAEGRYLASFFVLLWVTAFRCLVEDSRASFGMAVAAALLMLAEALGAASTAPPGLSDPHVQFQIERNLKSLGVKPGDRVAMVTGNLPFDWAYLDGVRIAIQVSFSANGYHAREAEWQAARQVLAAQTATYLVSPAIDGVTNQPGWIPIATLPGSAEAVFAYPIHPRNAY